MVGLQRRNTDGLEIKGKRGPKTAMMPPPTPLMERPKEAATAAMREKGRQSCAECRRLKLKCSREWPCTSCEKRGCAQICPNGEMKAGKGKRLILADTEELHSRIQALEVALAQSHSLSSAEPHPLLTEDYLYSPVTPSRALNLPNPRPLKPIDEVIDSAFGTLTIGTEGEAKFVGSFAGSEYLREEGQPNLENNDVSRREVVNRSGMLTPPSSARNASGSFPDHPNRHFPSQKTTISPYAAGGLSLMDSFISGGVGAIYDIDALRAELPDWETEGQELVECYWENVNWMYQILPRPMFDNDHLLNAYDTETPANAHKLACVFFIMAIGVMFDLNRPPFDKRGEKLFLLGRACLSAVGLEHASPATVQALHLLGTYMINDKHGNGAEMFWPILGTAVKVAQSLGLHRDGAAFGLSEYEIAERRQVWWELVTYDRLQAICFGRPCATSNRTSDTRYPENDMALSADSDGFHRAKYRLMEMYERAIEIQTQTAPVPFSTIAKLDADLLASSLPESLLPNAGIGELPFDPSIHPHLVIHRLNIRFLIAQTRLLLNRPLFTRAMKDHPEDPSRSKVGASFLGLYESAQEIVTLVKSLVIYHPSLIARWWFFWFHAFSSAVCLSAIAIRTPFSPFASPAFAGMSAVCDISAAARAGCRAKKGLPILMRLRKRAHEALMAASQAAKSDPLPNPSLSSSHRSKPVVVTTGDGVIKGVEEDPDDGEDDLSHLTGSSAKLRRIGRSPSASASPPSNTNLATSTTSISPQNRKGNLALIAVPSLTPSTSSSSVSGSKSQPAKPAALPNNLNQVSKTPLITSTFTSQPQSYSQNPASSQSMPYPYPYATPSHSRQTSGSTYVGSNTGQGVGSGHEMSPSDNMSVSTTITLREPTMFDGIVPPPPPLDISGAGSANHGAVNNPLTTPAIILDHQSQTSAPGISRRHTSGSSSASQILTYDMSQRNHAQGQYSGTDVGGSGTSSVAPQLLSPASLASQTWINSEYSPWSETSVLGMWSTINGGGVGSVSPAAPGLPLNQSTSQVQHHGQGAAQSSSSITDTTLQSRSGELYSPNTMSLGQAFDPMVNFSPNTMGVGTGMGMGMGLDLGYNPRSNPVHNQNWNTFNYNHQSNGMNGVLDFGNMGMSMDLDFDIGMDMDLSMALGLGGGESGDMIGVRQGLGQGSRFIGMEIEGDSSVAHQLQLDSQRMNGDGGNEQKLNEEELNGSGTNWDGFEFENFVDTSGGY